MTSATVIITETRPNPAVDFAGVRAGYAPECEAFWNIHKPEQAATVGKILSAPPFVIDPGHIANASDNQSNSQYYILFGNELGTQDTQDSLTKSQRFIVKDISQVPGWPSDNNAEAVLNLWLQSKIAVAADKSIDPSGEYSLLLNWRHNTYCPATGITFSATVTLN